jgi:DNA-binding transcriptional ArsR family regulator
LLLASAKAEKITYMDVKVYLDEPLLFSITATFEYGKNYTTIKFPFFHSIYNLTYKANFPIKCWIEKSTIENDIVCNISQIIPERRQINIEFLAKREQLIKEFDGKMLFKYDFIIPANITTFSFVGILPEGSGLVEDSEIFQPFFPTDCFKGSDGRRIYLYWRKENVVKGEIFHVQIAYEQFVKNFELTNFLVGFILVVLASTGIVFFYLKRKPRILKLIFPLLHKDEKIIMDIILKHGGKVNQKTIVKESNYSKAKVSKVLKSLAERGIVRLERVGRTNKVFLVKDFEKQKEQESKNE